MMNRYRIVSSVLCKHTQLISIIPQLNRNLYRNMATTSRYVINRTTFSISHKHFSISSTTQSSDVELNPKLERIISEEVSLSLARQFSNAKKKRDKMSSDLDVQFKKVVHDLTSILIFSNESESKPNVHEDIVESLYKAPMLWHEINEIILQRIDSRHHIGRDASFLMNGGDKKDEIINKLFIRYTLITLLKSIETIADEKCYRNLDNFYKIAKSIMAYARKVNPTLGISTLNSYGSILANYRLLKILIDEDSPELVEEIDNICDEIQKILPSFNILPPDIVSTLFHTYSCSKNNHLTPINSVLAVKEFNKDSPLSRMQKFTNSAILSCILNNRMDYFQNICDFILKFNQVYFPKLREIFIDPANIKLFLKFFHNFNDIEVLLNALSCNSQFIDHQTQNELSNWLQQKGITYQPVKLNNR